MKPLIDNANWPKNVFSTEYGRELVKQACEVMRPYLIHKAHYPILDDVNRMYPNRIARLVLRNSYVGAKPKPFEKLQLTNHELYQMSGSTSSNNQCYFNPSLGQTLTSLCRNLKNDYEGDTLVIPSLRLKGVR